jgi:hypothetical protein
VIAVPPVPFEVKATVAALLARVTELTLGAGGAVVATKDVDDVDAALLPVALVATTEHVYVLPFVSELTVSGEVAPDAVRVVPPSLDTHVAVKPVMALPPLAFAVKTNVAELAPGVVDVSEGASGTVPATNDAEALDAALSPMVLVAATVQV